MLKKQQFSTGPDVKPRMLHLQLPALIFRTAIPLSWDSFCLCPDGKQSAHFACVKK